MLQNFARDLDEAAANAVRHAKTASNSAVSYRTYHDKLKKLRQDTTNGPEYYANFLIEACATCENRKYHEEQRQLGLEAVPSPRSSAGAGPGGAEADALSLFGSANPDATVPQTKYDEAVAKAHQAELDLADTKGKLLTAEATLKMTQATSQATISAQAARIASLEKQLQALQTQFFELASQKGT